MDIFGKWTTASCSIAIGNSEVDKIRKGNIASYLMIQIMAITTKGAKHS